MPKKTTSKAVKKVAKKSVAKKAVAKKVATKKVVAKKAVVKKAPAKKAVKKVVAKKAVAKKVATKKVVAKKAVVKKAPAKKAVKKVVAKKAAAKKKPIVTTVIAKIDAGFGNQVYIRGNGCGLSWDAGVLMENIGADEWVWSSKTVTSELEFKVAINDGLWSTGANGVIFAGATVVFEPSF